jgi:flagellar basal body-associated protein FliL
MLSGLIGPDDQNSDNDRLYPLELQAYSRDDRGKLGAGISVKIILVVLIALAIIGLAAWFIFRSAAKDSEDDY